MLAAAIALWNGGALVATVLGYLGAWHWALDLFSHFRIHLLLALGLGLAVAILKRRWALVGLALLGVAINGFEVGRAWWPPPQLLAAEASAARLRLVAINVEGINRDEAAVVAYLRAADPDIVAVEEVRPHWAKALAGLADRLPYQVIEPREDNFGIALLSRFPILRHEVRRYRGIALPWIAAEIDTPLGPVAANAAHPVPPMGAGATADRDAAIAELGAFVTSAALPRVLMGDLNATPWSRPYRDLVQEQGFLGSGIAATWPARLGPFGIPIDHILVDQRLKVIRRQVGPRVGSDHRPLLIEVERNG